MPVAEDPVPRLKERLRIEILKAIGERNSASLARTLGIDEPLMSQLQKGHLKRFGLQKLVRLLARINCRVDVRVVSIGPVPRPLYGPPRRCFPPGWTNYTEWYPPDLLEDFPRRNRRKHDVAIGNISNSKRRGA